MSKFRTLLVLVLSLFLLLSACSSSPPGTSTQSSNSPQPTAPSTTTLTPKYGGVLKIVVRSPTNYFGYPGDMAGSGGPEVVVPCMENLALMDARGNFSPTGLTTAYQASPDLKSVILTLRKDVKFHDGTDFNAQAVKWNLDQGKKARLAGTELFNSIDVDDDYNVRINVDHFDNRVFQAVSETKISSPTAFEKFGKDKIHTNPIGTGPFKFASFTPDTSITWERFDDYWGGKPYLDGIVTHFIKDDMAKSAALQSGDVDILTNIPSETAIALRSKGFIVAPGNIPQLWTMIADSVNTSSPLGNLLVRQAIDYAIDRDELAKLGNGFWEPAYQPSEPNSPGYISDFEGRRYNVDKAKELLAQAGYPDGFATALMFNEGYGLQDSMVAVQQMLSKAGIKADMQMMPRDQRLELIMNGWQNGLQIQPVYCGPTQYLSALNYSLGGKVLVSAERPPGWQEALNAAFYAEPEDFDAACQKLNTLIYENSTMIPLYVVPQCIYAMADYVQGAHMFESGNLYRWTPEKAWLNK